MKRLETAITDVMGERCDDKDPSCFRYYGGCETCGAWAMFDAINAKVDRIVQEIRDADKDDPDV